MIQNQRLLNVCVNYYKIFNEINFRYLLSLVDAELIYNLSSLSNCENLHLLISDWRNMTLIYVSHICVILFLLIVDFTYLEVYFLRDIFPKHTFQYKVLVTKQNHGILVLLYHCTDIILIFKVYASVFYNSIIDFD